MQPVAIDVVRVPYGEPAVRLLADRVRAAKGGDPLAPVTVVLPSNYAAVATRRELARRGGVIGSHFLTLYRVAERLGAPALAAAGRRPVSAPVIQQAVRAALAEVPAALAPVSSHPATELALAAAYRELAGVTDDALDAIAAQSLRAATVVQIVRMVRARLRDHWYDEHDLVVAATHTLATRPFTGLGPVIVHLPERVPPGGGELLDALAARGSLTVLVGATGVDEADRAVVISQGRAGIDVPPSTGISRPHAIRVVSASDPDEEVRTAVRLVVEGARQGVPLGRMAVLFGAANPYARILRQQLDAAGIAANGTPVRTLGDMLAGRVLRGLLALPDGGFRRPDVLAVLSSARVLDGNGRLTPVRVWERVSRAAGVVGGDDWTLRLAAFADERLRQAAAAEGDERLSLARRFVHEAEQAGSLAAFMRALMTDMELGGATNSWQDMAAWASVLLDRYVGDERTGWPEPEREAADRVGLAVDRLGALDALEGPAPTLEVFRRILDGELDVALQRVGRLGEGVLTGPFSLAVGLTFDRVVMLGLAEGTFPDRRLDDSLLPDRERAVAGGQLVLRAEHMHDDHRHFLAALAAGPATVCVPRGDLRQPGARTPCRWLLQEVSDQISVGDGDHRVWDQRHVVPSFATGVRRLVFPATSQEHRLAGLLREDAPLSARAVTAADSVLAAAASLAEARRSDLFTRFDGNLAAHDLSVLVGGNRALSATRLQAWATCPYGYLVEHVLGVELVDEPARRLRINPLDKGALVHEVLHRFVEEGDGGLDRLRVIGADVCDEFAARGRTGRQLFWHRDRAQILADLERYFADDAAWRERSGARTVATERRFDIVLDLPDAPGLRVRGVIDRVDRLPDGSLVVFDYKTGRADGYLGLSEDEPHQGGARLQPVIYAAAARHLFGLRPVRFDYWFVTGTGEFEIVGYHVTDAVQAKVGSALRTIVNGIKGGIFPLHPPKVAGWNRVDCWFCAPDGLNATEARNAWERKRADTALDAYVELCEPKDDDGPR